MWRVRSHSTARATAANEAIGVLPKISAHNHQGDRLTLLPYGGASGMYTQTDTAGERVGALLIADTGGWLHNVMPLASLERYRVASPSTLRALSGRRPRGDGTVVLDGAHYARLGADYVEVAKDAAASTATRRIWRVVAPPGIVADIVAYRLVFDRAEGLWRQAGAPSLAGGMRRLRAGSQGRARVGAASSLNVRMTPDAAQLTRFHNALSQGLLGASGERLEAFRALLDRVAGTPRGVAILNAMAAYYERLDQVPHIVLGEHGGLAGARPSLDAPVRGNTWHLDLDALRFGTTEAAVQEFAAVYNNMTGLLQNEHPFENPAAAGEPALDPALERAWLEWLVHDPDRGPRVGMPLSDDEGLITARQLAVNYLRTQLREIACYGGLDSSALKAALRGASGRWEMRLNLSHRGLNSVPPLPADLRMCRPALRNSRIAPSASTAIRYRRRRFPSLPAPGMARSFSSEARWASPGSRCAGWRRWCGTGGPNRRSRRKAAGKPSSRRWGRAPTPRNSPSSWTGCGPP
ncbi:hypothetical protein [Bordetella genomosp. 9]|uniref:hypothetical protein n=1 Tax=Bordetella genomosp. 9 TaxID=1416803 RepID=UPI001E5EA7A4|nr:hypothetical protein [Bordetella genomosp. 9]